MASCVKSRSGIPIFPGNYTIKLKVEDSEGLADTDEVHITVTSSTKIAASMDVSNGGFGVTEIPDDYQLFDTYPNPFRKHMQVH